MKGRAISFALRDEDNNTYPYGYVDGYSFGDRLLEGVRFKVGTRATADGEVELVCKDVHPDDRDYVSKLTSYARFGQAAVDYMLDDGDSTKTPAGH